MKELNQPKVEKDVEAIMGNLLRTGVLVAASIVLIGGALYLLEHNGATPDYKIFKSEPADFKSLIKIFSSAFSFSSLGIIQAGIVLLIATPIARVVFSIVAFLYERDYMYVIFTIIVLTILLYSLLT